jgi:chromosome segregation ATPase
MSEKLDFISGGLMNIVLGALILWVGQTTFQHAGRLASVDEKFQGVNEQFADMEQSQESLRRWLEKKVSTSDVDKVVEQLRRVDTFASQVERRLTDRLTSVEVKLASVETRDLDGQQLATLQSEVAQLRALLASGNDYRAPDSQYQPVANIAQPMPVYLPPINSRR